MSRKKVQERIKMYAEISEMPECKFQSFDVYYNQEQKLWFLHLKFFTLDLAPQKRLSKEEIQAIKNPEELNRKTKPKYIDNTWSLYEEMECFDGKGWLKISNGFTDQDFLNVIDECQVSKFKTEDIKIKPFKISNCKPKNQKNE